MKEIIEKFIVIGAYKDGAFNFNEYFSEYRLVNSQGKIIDVFKECNLARVSKEGRETYKFLYNDSNGDILLLSFPDHCIINSSKGLDEDGKIRPVLAWTNGTGKSYVTVGKSMTVQNMKFDHETLSWKFEVDNGFTQTPIVTTTGLSDDSSNESLLTTTDTLEQIHLCGDCNVYDASPFLAK